MTPALRRKPLGIAAAFTLAAALLAACGSGTSANSITLYSGQHQATTQSLVTAFEEKTGIHIDVRYDDEDVFADEIVAEEHHPLDDVFYTENAPVLEYLQNKGLLAPVDTSTLTKTASKYDSPEGDWVGVSARVSVLIYNPSLIKKSQLPTGILQLADAKYKGKVALANEESDFQPIVTSVDRAYGKTTTLRWLKGLKANASDGDHIYPDNETIADNVNRGVVAFGVVNQYYYYRLKAELPADQVHSAITHLAPHNPGYVLSVSGAAILKSSKHMADDQKFLAFLVSKQGQEIIGCHSLSFEYPLDDGVKTCAPETPFSQLQPNSITIADLGDGSTAISLLREAGIL